MIDIGSGSARTVVMQVNAGGGVEIVAQQRVTLNLMSHVDENGVLDGAGVAGTVDAIEDFALVARGFGIQTIHAVATAAIRESANAAAITDAAREKFGIKLRIIGGEQEAVYCFMGSVHGLPVSDGLMADIGGGSMEVVRFADRTLQTVATLPLGSLRISNQFRLGDRPAPKDVAAAYEYVRTLLADAEIPALPKNGVLVGSGGSIRLLSRLDRDRAPYPITRMHGYEISGSELEALTRQLIDCSNAERSNIRGMNLERSHSIVGGAIVAHALVEHVSAQRIMASGQGLREGLARASAEMLPGERIRLPSTNSVRATSLIDLTERFASRYSGRGARRATLAGQLASAAWRGRHKQLIGSLECAALLLDIGNSIDFYNRLNRAASIITSTDLPGFTHREATQIAAIMMMTEGNNLPSLFRKSRLLTRGDRRRVGQAAAILLVADALDRRLPLEYAASMVKITELAEGLRVRTPAWSTTATTEMSSRWKLAFNQAIDIARGES